MASGSRVPLAPALFLAWFGLAVGQICQRHLQLGRNVISPHEYSLLFCLEVDVLPHVPSVDIIFDRELFSGEDELCVFKTDPGHDRGQKICDSSQHLQLALLPPKRAETYTFQISSAAHHDIFVRVVPRSSGAYPPPAPPGRRYPPSPPLPSCESEELNTFMFCAASAQSFGCDCTTEEDEWLCLRRNMDRIEDETCRQEIRALEECLIGGQFLLPIRIACYMLVAAALFTGSCSALRCCFHRLLGVSLAQGGAASMHLEEPTELSEASEDEESGANAPTAAAGRGASRAAAKPAAGQSKAAGQEETPNEDEEDDELPAYTQVVDGALTVQPLQSELGHSSSKS